MPTIPTPATPKRPILQNSCALATSAEEAGYRIDAPIPGRHGARVVALDDGAATVVRRLAREQWNAARFYTLSASGRAVAPATDAGGRTADPDLPLHRTTGADARLSGELADADVTVMVATERAGAAAATAAAGIGRACARRGVMTAGVVLGGTGNGADGARGTVHALRPHARVLLVGADDQDVTDLLTAIRA